MNKSILICADPIWPDLDKFNEGDWLERLRGWGILGVNFLLDCGLEIEYNPEIIEPGIILGGFQTFELVNQPEIKVCFEYREDLSGLDTTVGLSEPIATIPLQDYLSLEFASDESIEDFYEEEISEDSKEEDY